MSTPAKPQTDTVESPNTIQYQPVEASSQSNEIERPYAANDEQKFDQSNNDSNSPNVNSKVTSVRSEVIETDAS